MSPRSSLLRRVAVPLLAVAATALVTSLCAPARAATATLASAGMVSNSPNAGNSIIERVNCTITDSSTWNQADFYAQQLAQNGALGHSTGHPNYSGPGYYQYWGTVSSPSFSPGNYNLWVICSGIDYYHNPWQASTGGTLGTF